MFVNNYSRQDLGVVKATGKLQENKDNSPTHSPEQRVSRTHGVLKCRVLRDVFSLDRTKLVTT